MAENNGQRDSEPLRRSLAKKIVVPLAATAGSAIASYAAKRAPELLEQKVLPFVEQRVWPKVRDATTGAGDLARDAPTRAKSVAGNAGDVAHDLTERARSLTGGDGSDAGGGSTSARRRTPVSAREMERRRQQRAKAREARRKASSS